MMTKNSVLTANNAMDKYLARLEDNTI
jgi:hypothetical protein